MDRMRALDLFKGRHFDREIIVLCVRWYLRFKLSSRDLVQMMAERGIALTHTTILRWVQRYVPEFEKRWNKYSRPVGGSWRCDETYIKVKGRWTYLYRAVDKQGRTVDFLLSERRDVAAAKRFFIKAMKKHGTPRVITLDAYAASHRAITELKSVGTIARRVGIRSSLTSAVCEGSVFFSVRGMRSFHYTGTNSVAEGSLKPRCCRSTSWC
jgi:transposase-like protein